MKNLVKDAIVIALFGLLAAFCVARAFGQPQAPPVASVPPQAPPVKVETSTPKVVFVGTTSRPISGAITLRDDSWHPAPAVVVYPLGYGKGMVVGVNATNAEIKAAIEGRQVQPMARPFRESQAVTADDSDLDARVASLVPKGTRFYKLRPLYQNMYTMNNGSSRFADPTTIHDPQAPEHHPFIVSGGMVGLHGWKSAKGLMIPEGEKISVWRQYDDVRAFALVDRWRWRFPIGTVAIDVLSTPKGVFEVRTQTRAEDGWETKVSFKDEAARPEGYGGLTVSCASCHSHAGEIVDVPGRIYRRERWGSDGRFSFRPYREDGSLDRSWPLEVK